MADYLHQALRDHPRTRRLGELIADLTYPITSSVLNSGYVPFPGALLRSVEHLKQTSDYIFQTPYERLVLQIEESRQLRQNLENQVLSREEEYQCLRCSQNASEIGVLRAEHTSALDDQRSSFQSQVQNLQTQINIFNTRVEALLVQLSQRDDENSSLKVSLAGKEKALIAALEALEAIRAENQARDEQAQKDKAKAEEEARNRPKIDTSSSYDRQQGILTPRSLHPRESSLPMTDIVAGGSDPAQVALPSEHGSLLDEVPLDGLDQESVLEKQSVSKPESIPEVNEEKPEAAVAETTEKDPEKVTVETNEKQEVKPTDDAVVDDGEAKTEHPTLASADEEAAQQYETVNIVVEPPNETTAPAAPTEEPTAESTNPPEGDHAPEQVKDDEAKITGPSPTTSDVDNLHPEAAVFPASPATPERSPSPSSSLPVPGKHPKQSSGYNGAFSSFAHGGPDFFKSNAEPLSPNTDSTRQKRHSFFGRHEAPHAEKDKDASKEKEKPSLRSRVFSHTHSHSVSHTQSKSDEESSINSLEPSKKLSLSRPESPDSIGKLTRRHSRFETYVVDPLERKASQVVRKGRELLRHESHHSLHRHPDHEHSQ